LKTTKAKEEKKNFFIRQPLDGFKGFLFEMLELAPLKLLVVKIFFNIFLRLRDIKKIFYYFKYKRRQPNES
jgi:hypothetical protein